MSGKKRTGPGGGRPMDDYLFKLKKIINQHGWAVQGVFPIKEGELGFSYTVGMTEAGLPELMISGLFGKQAQDLLNIAAKIHLGAELKPGTTTQDVANVEFRVIDAPLAEIGVANRMYGPRARAVQLVWPEADGSWPDPVGPTPHARQELFGQAWWDQ